MASTKSDSSDSAAPSTSTSKPSFAGSGPRIGLFGGSFDPIHNGHIEAVDCARRDLGLEQVIYLPTARPPHKPGQRFAPALRRFCMVELALLERPELQVSAYELESEGPTYTVDTVEHFHHTLPGAELFLFLGADSYLELDQWHRWRDLVASIQLVVLARPGFDLSRQKQRWSGARVHWPRIRSVDLSSTALRERLSRDELAGAEEIPGAVLDYIRKYRLYL